MSTVLRGSPMWIVLGACAASAPSPFFQDADLIRFGVDPHSEAMEVAQSFSRAGYEVEARIAGQHFTALGFTDGAGRSRGVRVVTVRGVALALDSIHKGALADRLEYHLYMPPVEGSLDADGDGFEELFILEEGREGGACVVPYRVRDSGFVDPVRLDLRPFGAGACVRSVGDVDEDGRIELLVTYRVERLALPQWPQLPVLLFPDGAHGFGLAGPPDVMHRHYEAEAEKRVPILEAAAQVRNVAAVYRLAVEIALSWHLEGAARATEEKLLQGYFAKLRTSDRDAKVEAAIMARVGEGW